MILRRDFLSASLAVAGLPRVPLPRFPERQASRVQALIDNTPYWLRATRTPAVSIALLENGKFHGTHVFGTTEPNGSVSVTASSVYQAASLSKQAILYLALQAAGAGRLDLGRPLVQYIPTPPEFPEARLPEITARHVLTHTTGWPNWPANDGPFKPERPIGTWGYSGAGFLLLQMALEGIWNESAADMTRRRLLDPLGMAASSFVWRPEYDTTAVRGFERDGKPAEAWRPEKPNGASSLHTTSRDFARLLEAFLAPEFQRQYRDVYRQQVAIDARLGWSLGWGTAGDVLWQWGHSNGFKTFVALRPAAGLGIVCLSNGAGGQRVNREWVNGWLERNLDAFYFESVEL